jgi:HEAT repeat protein
LIEKLYKFCQYDQPEVLHILLKILERTGNDYIKATIIKILGYKKDKDLLLTLSQFLKDEDPRVRSNTVEAIERIGSKEGIKLLVPLLQDEDNRVKATVARALGKFGEEEVYTVLSQMLDSFELWMR